MDTFVKFPDGSKQIEEDFELFLAELAILLNKYHYIFDKAKFFKFPTSDFQVVKFVGDIDYIYPHVGKVGE